MRRRRESDGAVHIFCEHYEEAHAWAEKGTTAEMKEWDDEGGLRGRNFRVFVVSGMGVGGSIGELLSPGAWVTL